MPDHPSEHIAKPTSRSLERSAGFFSRILACVGGSPWLESQVETVVRLCDAMSAETVFLHVTTPGTDSAPVRTRIEAALATHHARAEICTVASGGTDRAILREVHPRGVDLLYAGAAPHEPVLRDILGSTARRIARRARCSVLLDSEPRGRGGRFPTTVVSVRMDEASRRMVRFAVGLAKAGMIDHLHIVREIEPVPPSVLRGSMAVSSQIVRAQSDAELREFVSGVADASVPMRSLCVEGREQSGVVSYSETVDADLVICQGPTRRIRTLGRLLGHEHETLLTDLPSALLLMQARNTKDGDGA